MQRALTSNAAPQRRAQVLVPLDGTARSAQVLPVAADFARALGHGVRLLHVLSPTSAMSPGARPQAIYAATDQRIRAARAMLEETAAQLHTLGGQVTVEVEIGDAAAMILASATSALTIEVIAMATGAGAAHGHWPFGSVAEQVLRAAPTPLLLVRPTPHPHPRPLANGVRKLLVPFDGSRCAEAALPEACFIAQATGATIVLLTVVPSLVDAAIAPEAITLSSYAATLQARERALRGTLREVAAALVRAGLHVETQLVTGFAHEMIPLVADEEGANLIVMATHGRTGWRRALLGSVALTVLHSTPLPVLLVRALEDRTDDMQPVEQAADAGNKQARPVAPEEIPPGEGAN